MNTKPMLWGVGIVAVIFLFLLFTVYIERKGETSEEVVMGTPVALPSVSTSTARYENPSGFEMRYPGDYTLSTSSDNDLFSSGVSFMVPSRLTNGTNLSSNSRIYIEARSATSSCAEAFSSHDLLEGASTSTTMKSINGKTYSVISASSAGAGNFYETTAYVTGEREKCFAIFEFAHSTNVGNYEPGTVILFDRESLERDVEMVLSSFSVQS